MYIVNSYFREVLAGIVSWDSFATRASIVKSTRKLSHVNKMQHIIQNTKSRQIVSPGHSKTNLCYGKYILF